MDSHTKTGSRFGSRFHELSGNQFFGQRLKNRRELFGYSQVELAKKIGANKSTIQNYESGSLPKGDYLILLAKELKCTAGWLLAGEGPGPDQPESASIYKVETRDGLHIAAPGSEFEPHGGWKPRQVAEDYIYAGKLLEILAYKNSYSRALMANIDAFHNAIQAEKELIHTQKTLENQVNLIKKLEERLAALEKKSSLGGA